MRTVAIVAFRQRRSEIKRLALAATLLLAAAGCATIEEFIAPESVEPPLEESRAIEKTQAYVAVPAAPAVAPAQDNEQPEPPVKPAADAKPVEPRTPLKDVFLKSLGLPDRGKQRYVVKSGDSLGAIADRHHVTLQMLKWANRLETDRIRAGQKLAIPAAALRIEIDKSENKLRLFNGGKLVRMYPVATGDQGVTAVGSYKVVTRLIQPTWYWQGYAVPPGDPDYPLGTRWLGLSKRGYGIHGTNEPDSIGKQASHGCVRMHNADVEELFEVVPVGTAVKIVE